ncbi:MAG: DUF2490 domain-containing protein [Phaeodactylibacter sp.]|nr:DUF2490 domain-containing protein [Phaeodactylibacter sp.]
MLPTKTVFDKRCRVQPGGITPQTRQIEGHSVERDMRTTKIYLATICLGLLAGRPIFGQSRTTIELLPQLSWNGELGSRWGWSLNTSLESGLSEKVEGRDAVGEFSPHTYNFQGGLAYQLTNDVNLSGGYQFGWRNLDEGERDIEHRALQQLSWARRWGKYRARLRARAEQRFFRSDNWGVRHRWRLRPSLDFPLQGERLDPRETYLNAQIEWLTNIFEESPLYYRETRLYAGLGWQINEHYKLENGLEWRNRRSDAEGNRRHRLLYRLTLTFR